jgi:molybdopterin converting factor small subunit
VKVAVQLFATLAEYLPPEAVGDSVTLELPAGTTVDDVVRALRIPEALEYLRVVNGHERPSGHHLVDGDVLTLFPPLSGG